MAALLDALDRQFDEDVIRLLSDQVGASEDDTRSGVAVALPLLVGAVAAQVREETPEALDAALTANHDGTLFNHLTEVLERSARGSSLMDAEPWLMERLDLDRPALDGDGILEHLVGDRRERVALAISRVSNLQAEQVDELLPVLAPIVMSALGHVKRTNELDAKGLRHLLSEEHHTLQSAIATDGEAPPLLGFLDVSAQEVLGTTTRIGEALRDTELVDRLLTHTPT